MKLSERLAAVAALITKGNSIADIGTDHGYIPIYMAMSGSTDKAIAMDVNEGPLLRARDNINKYKVEKLVTTRLSDGLNRLKPYEAESIVIAGMGGLLIEKILKANTATAHSARELILSPHSDSDVVRHYLITNNWQIDAETMVYDEGKYYTVLRAVNGRMNALAPWELMYGRELLNEHNLVLYEYLNTELDKKNTIMSRLSPYSNHSRVKQLKYELELIMKGLEYYAVR